MVDKRYVLRKRLEKIEMVSGKDIADCRRIVERFERLENMFNEDGSVRNVEEYRSKIGYSRL